MKINVTINEVKIEKIVLNDGEYKIHECEFKLPEEFNGLVQKAIFWWEDDEPYEMNIVDGKCDIPIEVLKDGHLKIGVYAYEIINDELICRYSPSPDSIRIHEGSYVENAQNSEPITPTDKEQIEQNIVNLQNDVEDLEENKQDKLVSGENIKTINGESVLGTGDIEIDVDLSDYYTKEEVDQSQATQNDQINANKGDIESLNGRLTNYSLITETGSQIALNINSSNYQMTAILKDKNGNVIYTSNVIDLPIESMIINATYDDATKEIVFTLQNGNVLRVSVADLVSGLVSTDELNTILGNYYTKSEIDSLLTDYVKNTDYATGSKGGVIRTNNGFNVTVNGETQARVDDYNTYLSRGNIVFISKGTLENVITGKELINQTTLDESQAEQDANIEENASNIEELQNIVDQLPHEEGEGTDIELEPTIEAKMSIGEAGSSSQFSTEGYQMLDLTKYPYSESESTLNGATVSINNGIMTVNATSASAMATVKSLTVYPGENRTILPAGTYYFGIRTNGQLINGDTYTSQQYSEGVNTIPYPYRISQWFMPVSVGSTPTIPLLISNNSSKTSYELYTDGPAPNPSYPFMPSRVTGENSVVICNENLFDKNSITPDSYLDSDGNIINNATWAISNYIPVIAGEDYIYRGLTNVGNAPMSCYYDRNKQFISSFKQNVTATKITIPSNVKYVRFTIENKNTNNIDTFMFFKGSAIIPFVEHEGQTYQLSLGNIELNSSPDGTVRDAIIGSSDVSYNLFDKNNISKLNAQIDRNALKLIENSSTRTLWIKIQPNTTYTVSKIVSSRFRIATLTTQPIINADLTKYVADDSVTSLTITSEANDYYLAVMYYNSTVDTLTEQQILDSIQITEGSEVKPYFPYGQKGMWCKREYIGKKIITNSEGSSYSSKTNTIRYTYPNILEDKPTLQNNQQFCNYLRYSTSTWAQDIEAFQITDKRITFNISKTTVPAGGLNNWLSTNNLIFYYELATSQDIPITDTTLINQLNDLYDNAHSYKGTTNITSTCEDGNEQMYLDASALTDIAKKIDTLTNAVIEIGGDV